MDGNSRRFVTFESNVVFALRFMVDTDVVGGNWVSSVFHHANMLLFHCWAGVTSLDGELSATEWRPKGKHAQG